MRFSKTLVFFIISTFIVQVTYSQELAYNADVDFYEYSHVEAHSSENIESQFENRLKSLNYKEVEKAEKSIVSKGFTSHLVGGFATVEISYLCKVQFKENRYKLTLTNFILTDKNGSNKLEEMRGFKKKWVKIINSKLPKIVDSIEKTEDANDW